MKMFLEEVKKEKAKLLKKYTEKLSENTPVDTGEASDGWYTEGNSMKNSIRHIEYLNQGSSRQAGAHFVEKTLLKEGAQPNGVIVQTGPS